MERMISGIGLARRLKRQPPLHRGGRDVGAPTAGRPIPMEEAQP